MSSNATTTATRVYRAPTQGNRKYDHLYDPVYHVSSQRDHDVHNTKAMTTTVQRVPDQENYFCEMEKVYPSHHYRETQKLDVPAHLPTTYDAVSAYSRQKGNAPITGTNRALFFRRPMIPFLHSAPPEVLLERTTANPTGESARESGRQLREAEPATKTVGTQSMYRESEAQTDPYTPAFRLRDGANEEPEILSLQHLKYGQGLPATLKEVTMIDRARQKRAFERSLPPITDESSFDMRKRMMEAQELLEFNQKKSDLEKQHEYRLAQLRAALDKRERDAEFIAEQRTEAIRQQSLESKDRKIADIQRRRIKGIRKLVKARNQVDEPLEQRSRDIVADYSKFSSKVYAPIIRDGSVPVQGLHIGSSDIRPASLLSVAGINSLSASLRPEDTKVVNISPTGKRVRRAFARGPQFKESLGDRRKRAAHSGHLEMMDALIKEQKRSTTEKKLDESLSTDKKAKWKRNEKIVRPKTPRVSRAVDDLDDAVTLLQRLVRGRCVQNEMFAGKEKNIDLINELRYGESINANAGASQTLEEKMRLAEEAAAGAIGGTIVSSALRDAEAEERRRGEEARILNLVNDAEMERASREAAEAGRRQGELILRDREADARREITDVHYAAADSIIDECLDASLAKA